MSSNLTYIPNIPNGPNNPSNDQPNMQINTNSINSWVDIDHFGFNDNAGGLHQFVRMFIESGSGALPVTVANEGTIYPKIVSGTTQMFYSPDNSNDEYQMTRAIHASFNSFGGFGSFGTVTANYAQTAGWTFLPGAFSTGGLLYQYGSVISTRGTKQINPSTIVVTFPVTFSTSNIVIQITPICKSGGTSDSHTASLQQGTVSTTGFTCNFDSSTTSYVGFTWTAIGV